MYFPVKERQMDKKDSECVTQKAVCMGEIMDTILIIEDDKSLAEGLSRALSAEQTKAVCCGCLREARRLLQADAFALVLLDINLPDGNGFEFLAEIKEKYQTSVILLTANDLESDIVAGLEGGADDYITKPFALAVLRARVQTQLRRRNGAAVSPAPSSGKPYMFADYLFDFEKMQFFHGGVPVELSKNEQKLLRIFTENAGITLPRGRLIDYVWTDSLEYVEDNALYVTVKRLRDKLGAADCIETVYGIGYCFHPEKKSERNG